jgi:hypothetical protein
LGRKKEKGKRGLVWAATAAFRLLNITQPLAFQFLQLIFVCPQCALLVLFVFALFPKVALTYLHLLEHFEGSLFVILNVFS